MTNMNAEAVEFEIKRLRDCCKSYRERIAELEDHCDRITKTCLVLEADRDEWERLWKKASMSVLDLQSKASEDCTTIFLLRTEIDKLDAAVDLARECARYGPYVEVLDSETETELKEHLWRTL